jgi:hypothetical protein
MTGIEQVSHSGKEPVELDSTGADLFRSEKTSSPSHVFPSAAAEVRPANSERLSASDLFILFQGLLGASDDS